MPKPTLVCVLWDERSPRVPSVREACRTCGANIAVSQAMVARVRGGECSPRCLACTRVEAGGGEEIQVQTPPEVRRELEAMGELSGQIDSMQSVLSAWIRRPQG